MSCFYCKTEKENEYPFMVEIATVEGAVKHKDSININRCEKCYIYHEMDIVFSSVFGMIISGIVVFFSENPLAIIISFLVSMCLGFPIYNVILNQCGIRSQADVESSPIVQNVIKKGGYVVK